jgi:Na+/proline symporter
MNRLPVTLSILATETSGASLLLFPNLGFRDDFRFIFLQMVLGYITGRIIISYFFIKPIYESGVFSIYEYFEKKINISFSRFVSYLFIIATILSAGIRLFIASLGLYALFMPNPNEGYFYIILIIFIAGTVAIFYSRLGGLKGVIRTDTFQFFIIVTGCLVLILFTSFSNTWPDLQYKDFILLNFKGNFFGETYFFPVAFFGGAILTLGSHGADQTLFQRVLSCKNITDARRSMLFSAFLIFPLIAFFLLTGYILSGSTLINPTLQQELKSGQENIIPYYVRTYLSAPFRGIFAIVFLSAAMSSIDSCLHSLSTILAKTRTKISKKISAANLSIFSGFALIVSAIFFQYLKYTSPASPLISLALGVTGMVFAPLAALFFSIIYIKKHISPIGSAISLICGIMISVSVFLFSQIPSGESFIKISWIWGVIGSFFVCLILFISFHLTAKNKHR